MVSFGLIGRLSSRQGSCWFVTDQQLVRKRSNSGRVEIVASATERLLFEKYTDLLRDGFHPREYRSATRPV